MFAAIIGLRERLIEDVNWVDGLDVPIGVVIGRGIGLVEDPLFYAIGVAFAVEANLAAVAFLD